MQLPGQNENGLLYWMGFCPGTWMADTWVLPGHRDGVLPGHIDGGLPGHMDGGISMAIWRSVCPGMHPCVGKLIEARKSNDFMILFICLSAL